MEHAELNWEDFLKEGNTIFLKAKKWSESKKFSNDLIYNLVLMSIEKNFMSICMKNNYLPENHTLSDLVYAANRVIKLDETLEKELLKIEKYQYICTVEDYNRQTDKIEDINLVVKLGHDVNELAKKITKM